MTSLALGVASFAAYVFLAVPGVDWLDAGELVAAAFSLGVSHPPGQPTYTLLGKLATLLPLGEVAFRVTLLSAATAALAVAGTVRLARELLDSDDWQVTVGAVVAAALLAASPMLVEQATRPEVYAPMAAAGVWAAVLAVRFARRRPARPRDAVSAALLLGLAAGIHPLLAVAIALPFAPSIALRAPRVVPLVLVVGFLGLGVNALLPIRAGARVTWVEPGHLGGFVDLLLGRAYAQNFQGEGTFGRALGHTLLLGEGTGLALLLVGGAGLVFGALTRLRGALPLAAAAAAVVLGTAAQRIFFPENPDVHGYLLAAAPLLATGVPALLSAVGRALGASVPLARALGVAVVALPVLVLGATGRSRHIDARSRRFDDVLAYHDATLAQVPAGPAILVTTSDHALFVNQYEQVVAGARPDVLLAQEPFLKAPWAVLLMKRDLPQAYIPFVDDGRRGDMASRLIRGNLEGRRPVWGTEPYLGGMWGTPVDGTLAFDFAPRPPPGMPPTFAPYPGDMGRRAAGDAAVHRARWELHAARFTAALRAVGALDRLPPAERQAVAAIAPNARSLALELPHASPLFFFADWQVDAIVRDVRFLAGLGPGDPPPAAAVADVRLLHAWHLLLGGDPRADAELAQGYLDARVATAKMLLARARDADAEAQLRKCAVERPTHEGCALMLAAFLGNGGRVAEAEALLRHILERHEHPRALAQLGLLLAKQNRMADAVAAWERSLALDPDQGDVQLYLRAAQNPNR